MPDKAHAEAALRLDHNAPASERPKIEAMAHKKLGESPVGDHKAMIAKMHPEHLHRLVQAAHAGQYGPEAKQMAQQAMQPAAMPMQNGSQPTMAPKRNPFSDTSDDDQQQASPAPSGSPFGG